MSLKENDVFYENLREYRCLFKLLINNNMENIFKISLSIDKERMPLPDEQIIKIQMPFSPEIFEMSDGVELIAEMFNSEVMETLKKFKKMYYVKKMYYDSEKK
jgi:hypothetical protein